MKVFQWGSELAMVSPEFLKGVLGALKWCAERA